jgi:hypothetical protein
MLDHDSILLVAAGGVSTVVDDADAVLDTRTLALDLSSGHGMNAWKTISCPSESSMVTDG